MSNDALHRLVAQSDSYRLRVDLEDFEGNSRYAVYSTFHVAGGGDQYRMGGCSGTAGDSLGCHSNNRFTTKDQDNDNSSSNCAELATGAWWYNSCSVSNLNGKYLKGADDGDGIEWHDFKGYNYSLKRSEMKFSMTG
ncbi:ficolin-2-like [Acanthaster planci]|uniref:Ficolin-2-like n=1 Tax=Acanthaster planci TaxID=133434 RepID=A0A8B7ZDK8_ACAPL|nr:ficolin-2-like [Acanthaster planci]